MTRRFTVPRAIHFEVVVALASRGLGLGLSVGTMVALTALTTPIEQGYYFTFLSLVALSLVADVGLTTVVSQFVAHERAGLTRIDHNGLKGPPSALGKIAFLVRLSLKWYVGLAVVLVSALWVGGFHVLSLAGDQGIVWQTAWTFAAAAAALDFLTLPLIAVLFGLGFVRSVYLLRLAKAVAVAAVLWSSLALGFGLMSMGLATLAGTATVLAIVAWRYGGMFLKIAVRTPPSAVRWREEMWPMQWRIAVSWLAGYLIFQTMTPIAFHLQGPVVAGAVGATMGLFNAILAIASTVMESQQTRIGAAIAARDAHIQRKVFVISVATIGLSALGVVAAVLILIVGRMLDIAFVERFLSPTVALIFLVAVVPNAAIACIAAYLRAHRQELFTGISVATALLMSPAVFVGCWLNGALGLSIAFTGVTACFALPAALVVLSRHTRGRISSKPAVDTAPHSDWIGTPDAEP